jgi:MinD-like ATPase involved in chromosome partitioning or flagellar assembly
MVTPDPQSQAEAFALLRVLHLNGFEGELRLLVNQVPFAMDASDIQQTFNDKVKHHLGSDAGLLEVLLADDCVPRAERYRQAFSAVFPESEAAAGIVVIADDIDAIQGSSGLQTVAAFWQQFVEIVKGSLQLPGNVRLDDAAPKAMKSPAVDEEVSSGVTGEGMLHPNVTSGAGRLH